MHTILAHIACCNFQLTWGIGLYINPFPALWQLSSGLYSAAYVANNMDPDQAAPLGAVWSGFIMFASMIKLVLCISNLCSRRNKQMTFLGKNISTIRVKVSFDQSMSVVHRLPCIINILLHLTSPSLLVWFRPTLQVWLLYGPL